ncbi:hypothetical protein [Variovorax sp. dw_954]|uniref:hypothetical protein n=1 Tax=Variovorax sp. dw_954 TaxID=2720078 RepID=UPI002116EE3C|nr:hypothetical protein [Variovorax sp. dw_954]
MMFPLSRRSERIGCFAAGALLAGVVLAFAPHGPSSPPAGPARPAHAARPIPRVLAAQSRLDVLRNEAASGDELSNRELSIALLDRYEQTGDTDDLYEAVIWIDRRWEAAGKAELIARVVAHHCGQRVLRWHWLCLPGE